MSSTQSRPLSRRGRQPWSERNIRAPLDSPALRLAVADPPYPGQSERHYGHHEDFAGEVDHVQLVARLMSYDGWVLHTGASMLADVLPLCPPGTRILAWTKTIVPFKPGVSVDFGWEPVLMYGGRRRHRMAQILPDFIRCAPVQHKRQGGDVIGVKPYELCSWIFECLGARPDDSLEDLFPGSGAVGEAWTRWQAQPALPIFDLANDDQLPIEAA